MTEFFVIAIYVTFATLFCVFGIFAFGFTQSIAHRAERSQLRLIFLLLGFGVAFPTWRQDVIWRSSENLSKSSMSLRRRIRPLAKNSLLSQFSSTACARASSAYGIPRCNNEERLMVGVDGRGLFCFLS